MDRTDRTRSAAAQSQAQSSAQSSAQSVRITSAQTSHSERIHGRQTRYLISMGVRTACFVLAVVTDGALRWVFIIAAVVLPYFAVVVANASGEVDRDAPDPFYDDSRLMLEQGPAGTSQGTTEAAANGSANESPDADRTGGPDEGKPRQRSPGQ
jgi:hypothetical protein